MYPLRFDPIFRRYLWGGRRLAEVLNKPIGQQTCAESWEIVDHNENQSVVKYGELAGSTLNELIQRFGEALLGNAIWQQIGDPAIPAQLQNRFPLLLKFLDANRKLSVQVHPDDEFGQSLDPPDFGKTEAWYVMHADPGSKIYAGLKLGITRDAFADAVAENRTEETLHSFHPQAGDCLLIQAGTLHAIGEGLLIAEIQQASDTTFRVFDWDRVDQDGKPRQLHIEQAIAATDFDRGPVNPLPAEATQWPNATTIVACDKFTMRRWELVEPVELIGDGRFHILAVTSGAVSVSGDPADKQLGLGTTMLLPAALETVTITPHRAAQVLDIFVAP